MRVQNQREVTVGGPDPSPGIRLICLACSRQDLQQYRAWSRVLSDNVELLVIEVQPLGDSAQGDASTAPSADAHALAKHLHVSLSEPHAIFGQHQGAQLAFELTMLAEASYPGQTRHLFVSSCDSPRFQATSNQPIVIKVPTTLLYPPGALANLLEWHGFIRRELELIELPDALTDPLLLNQRLVRIFNSHLGLLSF
ncbi:hypothetical protein G7009_20370 [Pseudomonas capeferrum]|uniref:thioesterase domain-containing protein n=1 Tax=Pseudomonas capeferrum TaxID=1495066 RepID=UPI0015E361F7|nr:thioesterase domain-containing protein [Pseudomonas capeferrum]MBA1204080.1 hypothetical protein [Pseudomonas capeferrum]